MKMEAFGLVWLQQEKGDSTRREIVENDAG